MKKNILFIMTDQMRLDALGSLSPWMKTPNLDELAAQGISFTSCYTNSPVCVPARFSLATGATPGQLGLQGNASVDLNPNVPTWTKAIKKLGYRTAVFGKTHLHCHQGDLRDREHLVNRYGFDTVNEIGGPRASAKVASHMTDLWSERGVLDAYIQDIEGRFKNKPHVARPSVLPLDLYADVYVGDCAVEYLGRIPDEPWFCWVSFGGPHEPWDAPQEYVDMYQEVHLPHATVWDKQCYIDLPADSSLVRRRKITPELKVSDVRALRENYAANVTLIDEQVGRIIKLLKAREMFDNTIIVFTSDHGEMNGDHEIIYKEVLLDAAVRVPMIVSTPSTRDGEESLVNYRVNSALVQLSDIGPTILELIGEPISRGQYSRSFEDCITHRRDKHREVVFSEVDNEVMVVTRGWKIVYDKGRSPYLLFDKKKDPDEHSNLISCWKYKLIIWRMRLLLNKYLKYPKVATFEYTGST